MSLSDLMRRPTAPSGGWLQYCAHTQPRALSFLSAPLRWLASSLLFMVTLRSDSNIPSDENLPGVYISALYLRLLQFLIPPPGETSTNPAY